MVVNASFNNISVILVVLVEETEKPEKTTNLLHVNDHDYVPHVEQEPLNIWGLRFVFFGA
jgi:hypothetical protein